MRLAVISDIHGNALALDAVLADIATMAPDLTVNLGDVLSGPFEPARTAEILIDAGFPTIAGNHDRWLFERSAGLERHALAELSEAQLEWVRAFPDTLVVSGDVFLCHGTPTNNNTFWLDDVDASGQMSPVDREVIEREAVGVDYPMILCGHTHIPRMVMLSGGRLVVNPGSVGFPGYDLTPRAHKWSAGVPHARYALLDRVDGRWSVDFRAVPYDFNAAADQAERAGEPAVASALRSGWV